MGLVKKKIRGISLWLNPGDHGISKRLIITKGMREPCFDWIIKKEASGTAFDIGANLGWVSLRLAKRCDKIYAFEPDKRNLKLLTRNATSKIKVVPIAISGRTGYVKMSFEKKPNLNAISEEGEPVESISIDAFCAMKNVKPDFIKMDVEGGEVAVLKGAANTLTGPLKILIEVHPDKYSDKNNFKEILEGLIRLGYVFKYVVNAKGKIDKFKNYECVKKFKDFPRAVFKGVPKEKAIRWATRMPEDGKKVIRSILLCKE